MTEHDNINNTSNDRRPAISIDYALYEHYLDDSDLSPEQKQEVLQALWTIICEFVALGFGVHSVQQAQEACGKVPDTGALAAGPGGDGVNWISQPLFEEFEVASTENRGGKEHHESI